MFFCCKVVLFAVFAFEIVSLCLLFMVCLRAGPVRFDKLTDRETDKRTATDTTDQQSTTPVFWQPEHQRNVCTPVLCFANMLNREGLQIRTTQVKPQ